MTAPTREPTTIGDILAEDWQRQKEDLLALSDPSLCDRSATELADIAERLAASYERDVAVFNADIRLRERPFIIAWPALARWRDSVLREAWKHPAHVVAAALEAMALECELAGYPELAKKARAHAESTVLGRRTPTEYEAPYAT